MTILQASEANRVRHFRSNTREDPTHPAFNSQRLCTAVWLSQIQAVPLCNLDKVPAIKDYLVNQLC